LSDHPDHAEASPGREVQPDHAGHAAEAGDQAERLETHQRPAGDDQGMGRDDGDDVGRGDPYGEEPAARDGSPPR
jgi:hypothetical protein